MTDGDVYGARSLKRHRRTKAELAELDDAIIAAVEEDHPVSLRGVYYRVVSAGAVAKTENGYRAVGRQLLKLRRSGRVLYGHITDGTRWFLKTRSWRDPDAALRALSSSYRKMLWLDQDYRVLLLSEKDAVTGTVRGVADEWDVQLGIARGYASESFAYETAMDLGTANSTVIYNLGDHDPSGVDAWKVFQERVRSFRPEADVLFERLAVTEAQIEEFQLPTRPSKEGDTRSKNFRGRCVEVDAIRAPVLRQIVEDAITQWLDPDALARTRAIEEEERMGLQRLAMTR